MNFEVKKGENNTYTVKTTVPASDVQRQIDHALEHEAEHTEVKGFRKGKAPLNLVKEKLDPSKLRSHALNHILPDVYSQIIKEHKIQPIIDPRFEIVQFEEGKDLIVNVVLIETPTVTLKNYEPELQKKADSKEKEEALTNEEVVDVIINNSEVGLAEILIEDEANRMLQSLIDQIARLGIDLDQYLKSINKSAEQVRKEYLDIAKRTLHADFALTQIAIDKDIKVTDDEIQKTIDGVPDEKSREALSKPEQKAYIRAILSKSKTIDTLAKSVKIKPKATKSTSKDSSPKGDK